MTDTLFLFASIAGSPIAIRASEIEAVVRIGDIVPIPLVAAHVRGLAADLLGREARRCLQDAPTERTQCALDVRGRERAPRFRGSDRLSLGIVGRRAHAELDARSVRLRQSGQELDQPRRGAHAQQEEARRERVERSGMADAASAQGATGDRDRARAFCARQL